MTKQNDHWEPKELTEKLVILTIEGKLLWKCTSWGFRVFIPAGSVLDHVVIDLEHREGDSGSEIPYIPPTADVYALYIKSAVLNDLLFWSKETDLIKPLWMAADRKNQPKSAGHRLNGKTYIEVNKAWPKSRECAALQKALKDL